MAEAPEGTTVYVVAEDLRRILGAAVDTDAAAVTSSCTAASAYVDAIMGHGYSATVVPDIFATLRYAGRSSGSAGPGEMAWALPFTGPLTFYETDADGTDAIPTIAALVAGDLIRRDGFLFPVTALPTNAGPRWTVTTSGATAPSSTAAGPVDFGTVALTGIPATVKRAAMIAAVRIYRDPESPWGIVSSGGDDLPVYAKGRFPDVDTLLLGHRTSFGIG